VVGGGRGDVWEGGVDAGGVADGEEAAVGEGGLLVLVLLPLPLLPPPGAAAAAATAAAAPAGPAAPAAAADGAEGLLPLPLPGETDGEEEAPVAAPVLLLWLPPSCVPMTYTTPASSCQAKRPTR
jgi:hypothetical protein